MTQRASAQNNFCYNKQLQPFANRLRKRMTKSEACMWKYLLSNKKMKGYAFRRQRPVLNYIADFMCKELLLIIEVDGIIHDSEAAQMKDKKRDKDLEAVGFTVLRFSNWEVLNRMANVAVMIGEWIDGNAGESSPSGSEV